MITTTLAVLALAGSLDLGVAPSTPGWQTDYAQAMRHASTEGKPMAVFIGQGADAFKHVLTDGATSGDAGKVLRKSYVCLSLDANTAAGKELAGRFQMSEGLVISGPGGSVQAYRHAGKMSADELTRQLTHYATAGQPTTTVTHGVAAIPTVIFSGGCPGGNCGISGQYVYPATYPFGSSCPNGRCPNQR